MNRSPPRTGPLLSGRPDRAAHATSPSPPPAAAASRFPSSAAVTAATSRHQPHSIHLVSGTPDTLNLLRPTPAPPANRHHPGQEPARLPPPSQAGPRAPRNEATALSQPASTTGITHSDQQRRHRRSETHAY